MELKKQIYELKSQNKKLQKEMDIKKKLLGKETAQMKELNDHIKNLYEEINFFKAERTRNG